MSDTTTDVVLDDTTGEAGESSPPNPAALLAEAGRLFYERRWVLGTSGNFSAVSGRDPLRLVITSSGADKGALAPESFVEVDETGRVVGGRGRSSAEAEVHLTVVRTRGAQSVLHTHSVWSTLLSEAYAEDGGLWIENYEMLKGLSGVLTHEHREWLPVIENSQRWPEVVPRIEEMLSGRPGVHGFLIRRHGLYTWGASVAEAKRHVEILEFLLEVLGRTYFGGRGSPPRAAS